MSTKATAPVLRLTDVHRVHGDGEAAVHALRGVSFTAYAGELVAVMGPSGSGKSTLLTIAGGLDQPTSGSVEVEGTDLVGLSHAERARTRRTSVGYVFQGFNLVPALTAAENVALPRELDGVRILEQSTERRLVLADEPTGALDTETGEEILRLLRARCDAGAAGVLVTHEARHAAWADRVVFLRDGVVVDESGSAPVDDLLEAGHA